MSDHPPPTVVGRYLLHRKIARGGMATIHIARLIGDVGFSRIVAAKRMHPELAEDAEFVAMFLDEAHIASRVQHRNVINVLDVVTLGEEVMLVQEYVHGAPLGVLLRNAYDAKAHVPVPVAAAIACQILAGLHAAHETVDELGTPLQIVHRDVSPQNILIATDGTARLLDFGVAKAALSSHITRKGTFKGKLGYSPPEQIRGEACRQSDIYSLAVVLWEMIVGHRLHATAQSDAQLIAAIIVGNTPPVTEALGEEHAFIGAYRWSQLEALDPVIRKALDVHPRRRWQTAQDMEEAIAAAVPIAPPADVAAWLRAVGKDFLDEREKLIAEEEGSWRRNAHLLVRGSPQSNVTTPPTMATEPDAPLPRSRSLLARIPVPTAIIATLVVSLASSVAFLARDLDSTAGPPPPTLAAPAPASVAAPAPDPFAPASTRGPALQAPPPGPAESEPGQEPPAHRRSPAEHDAPAGHRPPHAERANAVKPLAGHPMRPLPAHATVAAPQSPTTPSLDCTTPFYFEGRKRMFKPGCL